MDEYFIKPTHRHSEKNCFSIAKCGSRLISFFWRKPQKSNKNGYFLRDRTESTHMRNRSECKS